MRWEDHGADVGEQRKVYIVFGRKTRKKKIAWKSYLYMRE